MCEKVSTKLIFLLYSIDTKETVGDGGHFELLMNNRESKFKLS